MAQPFQQVQQTGTITACAGTDSASPAIQQFTVSALYLTDKLIVTAPADFEVSLSPGTVMATVLIFCR